MAMKVTITSSAEDIVAVMLCCGSRPSKMHYASTLSDSRDSRTALSHAVQQGKGSWWSVQCSAGSRDNSGGRTTVHGGHVRLFKRPLCYQVLLHVVQVGDLRMGDAGLIRSQSIATRARGGAHLKARDGTRLHLRELVHCPGGAEGREDPMSKHRAGRRHCTLPTVVAWCRPHGLVMLELLQELYMGQRAH